MPTTQTTTNGILAADETADLRFGALLIAEAEDGSYEPVNMVSTMREAREMAAANFRIRMSELETGKETMCPGRYVVWANGFHGYGIVGTIDPS